MLIVTDAQGRYSWSFQIMADGSLLNGEPFYRLEMPEKGWMSGVAGAMEDSIGQVYFATPLGVQVCEANGRVSQILNPPEPGSISSLTFAGTDMNWLYITEDGKLFRRPSQGIGHEDRGNRPSHRRRHCNFEIANSRCYQLKPPEGGGHA